MKILVRATDGWKAVEPMRYPSEDALQGLLKDLPEIIPRDPQGSAVTTVWCREFPTDAGPIDLVGIGSDGSVTVMECKLARNPQVRREVVGQVVDYASALWRMPIDQFEDQFARLDGLKPLDRIAQVAEAFDPEWDAGEARRALAEALHEGAFRLLISVDQLDRGLKRIIEYVNNQAGTGQRLKLVALSFPMYSQGTTEILVPESYGDESPTTAPSGGNRSTRAWTVASFLDALAHDDHRAAKDLALELIGWMERQGTEPTFGKGSTGPMYVHVRTSDGGTARPFDMSTFGAGTFEVLFNGLVNVPPFDHPQQRHLLKDRMNAIPGVAIQDHTAEKGSWVNFSIERVADPAARRKLMETLDWVASAVAST